MLNVQDHFRKSRKPSYTNVFHDRGGVVGVVEFETKEDLKAAIRDLDGRVLSPEPGRCSAFRIFWVGFRAGEVQCGIDAYAVRLVLEASKVC